jgi:predicted transcriptional regulator
MSVAKRPSHHQRDDGWLISSVDSERFRRLARRVMKRLNLTQAKLAELMERDPRTISRYFEKRVPLSESQAREIVSAFISIDTEATVREIALLQRFHSPNMMSALKSLVQDISRKRTPEEEASERRSINQLVLAKSLGSRLAYDGVIAKRRETEVATAIYKVLDQVGIELNITMRQISRLQGKIASKER